MIKAKPRVQNDVMGEKRCANEMAWSDARGVAAPVPRTGQCRQDKEKTARDRTQGPMKKRADLQLLKEHSQQQARTGEDWLR